MQKRKKESLRKKDENRRPANLMWSCSVTVKGRVDSKQATLGSLNWHFFTLWPAPQTSQHCSQRCFDTILPGAKTMRPGHDSRAQQEEVLDVYNNLS